MSALRPVYRRTWGGTLAISPISPSDNAKAGLGHAYLKHTIHKDDIPLEDRAIGGGFSDSAHRLLAEITQEEPSMSKESICIHGLDDAAALSLPDYSIVAKTHTREELRMALGSLRPHILVIDLDRQDSANVLIEALEAAPELAVVGVTGETDPKAMINAIRAGCRQLTAKPLDANDLVIAIRRAINESPEHLLAGRTIGVMGASGGAGSTTIACHLSSCLAQTTRASTLIVDLDLEFGGVARAWDIGASHTIADVAGAGAVDAVLLKKAAVETPNGVCLLARPNTIEEGHAIDEVIINQLVRTAKSAFANVVIDLPRKLDAVTWAAAEQCDKLIIVIQLSVPSVNNARRLLEVFLKLGMAEDRIEIVANRYRKNTHAVTPEAVEDTLKHKLLGLVPNDFKAVSEAIDLGRPMDTKSSVYAAIGQIAKAAMGQGPVVKQRGGWLSKLGLKNAARR